eukprot:690355-Rhodomonas_salina.1
MPGTAIAPALCPVLTHGVRCYAKSGTDLRRLAVLPTAGRRISLSVTTQPSRRWWRRQTTSTRSTPCPAMRLLRDARYCHRAYDAMLLLRCAVLTYGVCCYACATRSAVLT